MMIVARDDREYGRRNQNRYKIKESRVSMEKRQSIRKNEARPMHDKQDNIISKSRKLYRFILTLFTLRCLISVSSGECRAYLIT